MTVNNGEGMVLQVSSDRNSCAVGAEALMNSNMPSGTPWRAIGLIVAVFLLIGVTIPAALYIKNHNVCQKKTADDEYHQNLMTGENSKNVPMSPLATFYELEIS